MEVFMNRRLSLFWSCLVTLSVLFVMSPIVHAAITGTVTTDQAVSQSGRVYINVEPAGDSTPKLGNGISIAAPGQFTINGVHNGTYVAKAFMDVTGTGVPHVGDPIGNSAPFTVSGGVITSGSANIVLFPYSNPAPLPVDPMDFNVVGADNAVLVNWGAPRTTDNFMAATHLRIEWADAGTNFANNSGSKVIPLVNDHGITVITSTEAPIIANGNSLDFRIVSLYNAAETVPTTLGYPVQVGPPGNGARMLQGTLNLNGMTPSGPLYLGVMDIGSGVISPFKINGPTNGMSYTLAGLPAAQVVIYGFIDNNGNGYIDDGDVPIPEAVAFAPANMVNLTAGNVTGHIIAIPASSSTLRISSIHMMANGNYTDNYHLTFTVEPGAKRPVNAFIAANSPNLFTAERFDLQLSEWGAFRAWPFTANGGATRPNDSVTGNQDQYTVHVVYSDASEEDLTGSLVGEVNNRCPIPVSPAGPVLVPPASFDWTAPGVLNDGDSYGINVFDTANGQPMASRWGVMPPATSIDLGMSLQDGSYAWQISLTDINDNQVLFNGPGQGFVVSSAPVEGKITVTGKVINSADSLPLEGVIVTVPGIDGLNAASDLDGIFVLNNVPAATSFHLKLEKPASGYAETYSAQMSYTVNADISDRPFSLYPTTQIVFWGGDDTKGVISGRVMDSTMTNPMAGVSVTAVNDANPATVYPVRYHDGNGFVEGTSSYGNGRFIVLDVPGNDLVRVTASKEGFVDKSRKYRAYAGAITTGAIGLSEAVSQSLADVTGTISYSGGKTGRIYVRLASNNQYGSSKYYGTSIDAPGAFTIRGVPAGDYRVQAFMDVQGNMVRHLTDPVAEYPMPTDPPLPPLTIPVGGTYNIAGPIALQDIDPAIVQNLLPPAPPTWVDVQVGDGVAVLNWEQLTEDQLANKGEYGAAIYDGYEVNVTGCVDPPITKTVTADPLRENPLIITGLDKTQSCNFTVSAIIDGQTGAPSAAVTKTPVGSTSGSTIKGTVNLNGNTAEPGAKLYIAAIKTADETISRFTGLDPSGSLAYTIKGVPAGTFRLHAILDQNGDGIFNSGDIMVPENAVPMVTATSTVTTITKDITLSATESTARVTTSHWFNQTYKQEGYSVRAEVQLPFKAVRTATFTGGPGFQGIQDAGLNDWGALELRWDSATPPLVGDSYQLRVTFADGTIENHTVAVTGVIPFPKTLTPSGKQTTFSSSPTFKWGAPTPLPTGGLYDMWLNGWSMNGDLFYNNHDMPSTTTQVLFSSLSDPSPAPLGSDGSYFWGVAIEDAYGNRGEAMTEFCGPEGSCGEPLGEPPVVDDFNPKVGTPGTLVAITGSGFDQTTLQVRFGATSQADLGMLARIISATDTEIVAEVPYGAKTGAILVFSGYSPQPGLLLNNLNQPVVFTVQTLAALDTFIDSKPDNHDNSYSFTFAFRSNREDATFECSVDSGAYQACISPFSYETPSQGSHEFSVRAVDAYGKEDTTPAKYTWTIDTIAPTATVTLPVAYELPIKPQNILLTVAGSGVTHYKYVIDGGTPSAEIPVATKLTIPKEAIAGDGPHDVGVVGRDLAGNWQVDPTFVTITFDEVPPVVVLTGKPTTNQNDIVNQTGGSFAFDYTNEEPGSVTYECRRYATSLLTPPLFAACSSPYAFTNLSDGTHIFEVRGKDTAGNIAQVTNWQWQIDTIGVDPVITGVPDVPTNEATLNLTITNADLLDAYKYAIDGGAYQADGIPIATPLNVPTTGLADGGHILSVIAQDKVGNWTTLPKNHPFVFDTTPPTPAILGVANGAVLTSNNLTLQVTGSDLVQYSYRLDGVDPAPYSANTPVATPITLSALGEGEHTLYLKATDTAGNVQSTPTTVGFTVDTVAPVAVLQTPPADPNNKASLTLTVIKQEGGEDVVAYRYRLLRGAVVVTDWTAEKAIATPLALTGLIAGDYTLYLSGRDANGNWDETPTTYTWKMNATLPVVTIAGPANPNNDDTPTFTFSFSSAGNIALDHYRYKVMKGTATVVPETDLAFQVNSVDLATLAEGLHTLTAWAVDAAGNKSLPKTWSWTIDLTPPVIAVTATPGMMVKRPATGPTTVTLKSATPGLINWYYTSNGGVEHNDFNPAGTVITLPGTDGEVLTIVVYGTDAAGNEGSKTIGITAYTATGPVMTITGMPLATAKQRVDITTARVTATNLLSCRYQVAADAPKGEVAAVSNQCALTIAIADLAEGINDVKIQGWNGDAWSEKLYSVLKDTTAPKGVMSNPPAAYIKSVPLSLTVSQVAGTEAVAAYKWRLDKDGTPGSWPANETLVATKLAIPASEPGNYTLYVAGRDATGNWQGMTDGDLPSLSKYQWAVDTTLPAAPTVVWASDPLTDGETNTVKAPTFTFTSLTDNVTFECRLNLATTFTACGTATFDGTDTTASYTTPTLLPGNHTLRVRARDRAGNVSAEDTKTWKLDIAGPALTVTGMPLATAGKNADITPVTIVSTPVTDLVACRYQVDGNAPTSETLAADNRCILTVAIADLAEGSNAVKVQGRDKIGNWSSKAYTVLKDTTAPSFTVTVSPSTTIYPGMEVKLTVAGTGITGYRYAIDGGALITAAAAITIAKTTTQNWVVGEHTVSVEARDAVGNWGEETLTFTVKEIPVTAAIGNPPAALNNSKAQSLQVVGSGIVAYRYRLDKTVNGVATTGALLGTAGIPVATKIALIGLVAGEYRLYVAGKDGNGVWQAMPTEPTASWTVELTPPDTTIASSPPKLSASTSADFSFTSTAADLAGYECKLDKALVFTACDNPLALTDLAQGLHTLSVRAKDAAGNVDPSTLLSTYTWTVDTVAPIASLAVANSVTTKVLTLTVTGIGVTYYKYRVDGDEWSVSVPLATKTALNYGSSGSGWDSGLHTIQVIAQDAAGNWQLTARATTYLFTKP